MLWIHTGRFSPRDPKVMRIKLINLIQKPAFLYGALPFGLRVIIGIALPSIRRHLPDCIHPSMQKLPKRLWIACASREPATDAEQGNRFGLRARDGFKLRNGFVARIKAALTTIFGRWRFASGAEVQREPIDTRVIVYQRRRQLTTQPVLQGGG